MFIASCRPPRNDVKGISIAVGLILAWCALFYHGCWQIRLVDAPDGSSSRSSWADIIATFFLLEFVNTGRAHAASHFMLKFHLLLTCFSLLPV
jgi:hypothetical protein